MGGRKIEREREQGREREREKGKILTHNERRRVRMGVREK